MIRYWPTALVAIGVFVLPVAGQVLDLRIPFTIVPLLIIRTVLRMLLQGEPEWAFMRPAGPHDIVIPSTAGWVVGGIVLVGIVLGANWALVRVLAGRN